MTNLDTLLKIAREATQEHFCVYRNAVLGGDKYDAWTIALCDQPKDAIYFSTFNPSLIEKMLDEIKSARRMVDNIGLSNTRYDQAREALDAILKGCEG